MGNVCVVGGEVRGPIRGVVPQPDVLPVLLHVPRARHAHAARVHRRARAALHRRHAHHRPVTAAHQYHHYATLTLPLVPMLWWKQMN